MTTYVLHFTATNDVGGGFETVGYLQKDITFHGPAPVTKYYVPNGYKAIICGAELNSDPASNNNRLYTLGDVTNWLRSWKVPIIGYVAAPGFAVDKNGTVYWTTPAAVPVNNYQE